MEKDSIRNGKIITLAREFSVLASRKSGRAVTMKQHFDDNRPIQLSYGQAHSSHDSLIATGLSADSDAEVRSFDSTDDRFYVESFDAGQEMFQNNTLNEEIEHSSLSAGLSSGEPEMEQHNTLNSDLDAASGHSLSASSFPDEILQMNTLNTDMGESLSYETNPRVGKSASAEPSEHAVAHEYTDENETEETEQDSFSSASAFEDDIKAILSGQKLYNAESRSMTNSSESSVPESQSTSSAMETQPSQGSHDVFERMAKGMSMANAYDLGTLSLEQSFDEFDRMMERNAPVERRFPLAHEASARESRIRDLNDLDYVEDFTAIALEKDQTRSNVATDEPLRQKPAVDPPLPPNESVAQPVAHVDTHPSETVQPALEEGVAEQASVSYALDRNGPDWPPRPARNVIRMLTSAERERLFGRFEYQPTSGDNIQILGSWQRDNIVSVRIPQLDGKSFGGRAFRQGEGSILFHRNAQQKLINLWQAWENAGLLDRIVTYNGGFVARFIRNTQDRNPRPLSNHSWGTAFDINAATNGLGREPALLDQPGCVRELVEIANQNGFFWGGHFSRKDGMHFEIGWPF